MCYAEAASPRITETSICAAQQLFNSSCWAVSRFSSGGILASAASKVPPTDCLGAKILPQISQIYTDCLGAKILPQISQICTDCLGAKILPQISRNSQKLLRGIFSHRFHRSTQIVRVRRFSHRFHRIHRLFGCLQGGALVSSAPTELRWCTSCYVGALETSAPPEVSSFCVNPCNLWEDHSARVSVKSVKSVGGPLFARLVHFLLGWCT